MAFCPYLEDWMPRLAVTRPSETGFLFATSHISRVVRWMLALSWAALMPVALAAPVQTAQPPQTATGSAQTLHPARSPHSSHATSSQTHTDVRHRKIRKHAKAAPPAVAAPAPFVPPAPRPPAEQQPRPATVAFSKDELSIDAENSSLMQILDQITRQTGMTVAGLTHDERIYGHYGPAPMASTLTALLDGSGYNFVIIGGGANRPPTKLLLTASSGTPAASAVPLMAAPGNSSATPMASAGGTPAGAQPAPANPSDPTRPKTQQEILDELRKMHPQ